MAKVISIDGVMGVGKSTVASKLSVALNCPYLPERYKENPYIDLFYAGDFSVETVTACQKLCAELASENVNKAYSLSDDYAVVDVSPLFSVKTFALNAFLSSQLAAKDYITDYISMLMYAKRIQRKIHYQYVLSTSTDTILDRIKHRARNMEANVNFTFIDTLNKLAFLHTVDNEKTHIVDASPNPYSIVFYILQSLFPHYNEKDITTSFSLTD